MPLGWPRAESEALEVVVRVRPDAPGVFLSLRSFLGLRRKAGPPALGRKAGGLRRRRDNVAGCPTEELHVARAAEAVAGAGGLESTRAALDPRNRSSWGSLPAMAKRTPWWVTSGRRRVASCPARSLWGLALMELMVPKWASLTRKPWSESAGRHRQLQQASRQCLGNSSVGWLPPAPAWRRLESAGRHRPLRQGAASVCLARWP
mmetsp:Transcript_55391/g.89542  ORF Transcript_55391/g.89542 Transcript_55391/m.89542 type:complete len:205 (+) Transcript_55391:257-871(+)